MSEREYKRVTRQLKPFITLFIVVVGSAFLASCGGGSGSSDPTATLSSTEEPNATAQAVAVTGGTVPGTWTGRAQVITLNPISKTIENADYSTNPVTGKADANPPPSLNTEVYETLTVQAGRITLISMDGVQFNQIKQLCDSNGWTIIGYLGKWGRYTISLNNKINIANAIDRSKSSGLVEAAGPVRLNGSIDFVTNDPLYGDLLGLLLDEKRHLESIKAPQAWALMVASPSKTNVGVIDGGFRYDHEDLSSISSISYFSDNPIISPEKESALFDCNTIENERSIFCRHHTHGMHVSGIIGAGRNNAKGMAGVAGNLVNIHTYKSDFSLNSVLKGIEKLAEKSVRIINLSIGASPELFCDENPSGDQENNGKRYFCKEKFSVEKTASHDIEWGQYKKIVTAYPGILFIQASGNEGRLYWNKSEEHLSSAWNEYFATMSSMVFKTTGERVATINKIRESVLIVGSYSVNGGARDISPFTSLPDANEDNDYPFILAPGDGVISAGYSGKVKYLHKSGTSQAAPHVSGVAALIIQANPDIITAKEVRDIILLSADNKSGTQWKPGDGYRYLNAEAAVKEAIRRKVEVNCGSVTPPTVADQQGPTYIVISNRATRFSTLPAPKPNYPFGAYRWKTSEGTELLSTIEQANITFYVSSGASIHVTPVLMDGTVCTGSTKTSNVGVNIPEWKINPANNHRYEVISCGTWLQCRDNALALGGKLVTIRSQAENDWLAANFSMAALYWIGAYYDTTTRAWKWASGEPFAYSHWGDNLNNSGGDEYCSHFFPPTPGFWNDVRCGYEYSTKAIIEYLN